MMGQGVEIHLLLQLLRLHVFGQLQLEGRPHEGACQEHFGRRDRGGGSSRSRTIL